MGFGSWWHWLLLLLFCVLLYFHILFILRSRKLIMTEPRENQFFHPNLAWASIIPWVNIVWIPLTIFAVEKTIGKGWRKEAYFNDRVLMNCGRFMKYWLLVCIGLQFFRYLIVYYIFPLSSPVPTPTIAIVLNILDGAFYFVLFGTLLSLIWYPIRLRRVLDQTPEAMRPIRNLS